MIWPITKRARVVLEQPVTCDCVKQRRGAARPVRGDRLLPRVEVEQVVVRDQLHADREVVLVDLGDAVHQRDLGRRDVRRAAVVRGVAGVGDHRQPVRAEDVAGRRIRRRVVVADDLVARRGRGVAVVRLDDVRVEVAVGVGDEARRRRRRARRRSRARVRSANLSSGSRIVIVIAASSAKPCAVDLDRVGGVVVALVDRELGGVRRHARRRCRSCPSRGAAVVARVRLWIEAGSTGRCTRRRSPTAPRHGSRAGVTSAWIVAVGS